MLVLNVLIKECLFVGCGLMKGCKMFKLKIKFGVKKCFKVIVIGKVKIV